MSTAPGVWAILYDEELPDDAGLLIHFPTLPRVGEHVYDCRTGRNVRFVVKEVGHILEPDQPPATPGGPPVTPVEVHVIIARDRDPRPGLFRGSRPSSN